MRTRVATLVCLVATAATLAGCGSEVPSRPAARAEVSSTPTGSPVLLEKVPINPPAVVLHTGDGGEVTLPRSPGCWSGDTGGSCVDVVSRWPRPADLPVLVGAGPLTFDFPIAGWAFTATVTGFPDHPHAKHSEAVEVAQPLPGRFVIASSTETGDFQVQLLGDGPQGDYSASFRWRIGASAHRAR